MARFGLAYVFWFFVFPSRPPVNPSPPSLSRVGGVTAGARATSTFCPHAASATGALRPRFVAGDVNPVRQKKNPPRKPPSDNNVDVPSCTIRNRQLPGNERRARLEPRGVKTSSRLSRASSHAHAGLANFGGSPRGRNDNLVEKPRKLAVDPKPRVNEASQDT